MLHATPTPPPKTVAFKTADGAQIVGRLFRPALRPFAIVVISGATAVPQGYYARFAEWLAAERGLAVLTYDYRDMGKSAMGPVRASGATMVDWGVRDPEAARRYARSLYPDTPIWVLGHSVGAMMLPMQRDTDQISRVVGVASGPVHYSDHPWPYRASALAFWYGIGPLATAVLGYCPGARLGIGMDMPSAAYWQWRRWCTRPGYNRDDRGGTVPQPSWGHDIPVRLIALKDDDLIPPHCVQAQGALFDGRAEQVVIDPAAHDLGKVGHLSLFARRNAALWPLVFGG